MSSVFDQSDQKMRLSGGPLTSDKVFIIGFSGQETLSRLFSFEVQFLSTELQIDAQKLIGQNLTVEIDRYDEDVKVIGTRYFNGYVNRLWAGPVTVEKDKKYRTYRAQLVPWLWFLTQTSRCHIFFPEKEEKSIFDIIEEVMNRAKSELKLQVDWSPTAAKSDLSSRMVKHCVQYRETDFNFISRILEQFGGWYTFTHEKGKHTMVLSTKNNYASCEESKVEYHGHEATVSDNVITDWEHSFDFASSKWTHTDYDFEKPSAKMESQSPKISLDLPAAFSEYELYDYPGEYVDPAGDGKKEARIRQEEEEVTHNTVSGTSSCKTFTSGHKFNLASHPDDGVDEEGEYFLTTVQHSATQPYKQSSRTASYSNSFACIPSKVFYRPRRITPKPIVSGVQTGVVVGPKGKEIYTDKYGRIKVFFHWDRETRKIKDTEGENCSCWVRVAQNMAGNKWGFMAIPRIGQEVVLEFLEGDPDRPLVVGSVYNKEQMPHYDPEEHKTRTYIKTNSSEGGEGFNELLFDDKAEQELVFVHAQKNMDVRVRNDSKARIYGNRHQIIGWEDDEGKEGGSQYEMVMQDKDLNIKRNQNEHIEGNLMVAVGFGEADSGGEVSLAYEKSLTTLIGSGGENVVNEGDEIKSIAGSQSLAVKGDNNQSANNHSMETKMAIHSKAGMTYAMEAGMEMHIKSGTTMVLESGVQLSLKVGGNFITIDPVGVHIQGTLVNINSGGAAGSGGGCSPTAPQSPQSAEKAKPQKPEYAHEEKSGQKSCK
ncbi:MAG: type VI secretion system tip protein TssI/VgrG [Pirellulaceae bacterium]|nr:type VI secretion system tip protein TssI/VgrG [Pirellulaceae bacterium]